MSSESETPRDKAQEPAITRIFEDPIVLDREPELDVRQADRVGDGATAAGPSGVFVFTSKGGEARTVVVRRGGLAAGLAIAGLVAFAAVAGAAIVAGIAGFLLLAWFFRSLFAVFGIGGAGARRR